MKRIKIPRKAEPCRACGGTGHAIDEGLAGEVLRNARESAGLGLREIATKLGVSATHVSDVERGNRKPSGDFLERYLAAVGARS